MAAGISGGCSGCSTSRTPRWAAWGLARPVWHCSMRAAPGDKMLSDDEWAQIACDVMNRTGLSPFGQEDDAVRWVAVRHGDDHIHIVAMLARQDGRRPRVRNDRYRVREACLAAEERYGLRRTAPGDRTAAARPPGRIGEGQPAGLVRGAPGHAAAACQQGRRGGSERAGILRLPRAVGCAGPHPAAAHVTPASSRDMLSHFPETLAGPGSRSGTAAGSWPRT